MAPDPGRIAGGDPASGPDPAGQNPAYRRHISHPATKTLSGYLGCVSVVWSLTISSWKERVTDTLVACRLLPQKELSVYPNPASRGSAISLSWQAEPGEYQVGLFNMAGALIQQRMMEVGTGVQVNLLEIPADLSGGVYIIRAVRAGNGKMYSRKLIVL